MKIWSSLELRQQSRLLGEQERLHRLHAELMTAATSRHDYEPHDVTDDMAAIQADAIEDRLTAVTEALERISAGGYGTCVGCGSQIADERLEVLPATALCRRCAS